jgi:nicotinate-nucleotide adenylyltransferase
LAAPVGILGGTFDPIHFGHLRMAQELREELRLTEVRFIPTAIPPHRPHPRTDTRHRVAMVRLAIAGNDAFRLDDRELQRGGASYTYDTLTELRTELGKDTPLCLLIGGDAFLGLPTWHRWTELSDLAHIVVAHRPGAVPSAQAMPPALREVWLARRSNEPEALTATPAGRIWVHAMTALDISASAIRDLLQHLHSPRYLLPDSVCDYIHIHHLYQKG